MSDHSDHLCLDSQYGHGVLISSSELAEQARSRIMTVSHRQHHEARVVVVSSHLQPVSLSGSRVMGSARDIFSRLDHEWLR